MKDIREAMDGALKKAVIPSLRQAGFTGSFPHFRRAGAFAVDLLTFQFDKNGGGFVIELGRCSREGFTTHWGKHIPASRVTALDLHPDQRHRIKPREGPGTDSWFRFDKGQVQAATQHVLAALPRAESWWREAQPVAQADGPEKRGPA